MGLINLTEGVRPGGVRLLNLAKVKNTEVYLERANGSCGYTLTSESNGDDWWEIDLDSPEACGAEVVCGLFDTVNFSDTETAYIEWELSSSGNTAANFAIDGSKSNIDDDSVDNGNPKYSLQKKGTGGFSKQTDSISIGGDSSDLYVGAGAQVSTSLSVSPTMKIYRIYGEDSNGNILWELKIPNGLSASG